MYQKITPTHFLTDPPHLTSALSPARNLADLFDRILKTPNWEDIVHVYTGVNMERTRQGL